ncbi:thioester domain-containing protein [Actinoplanes bogorensis]|uniref:Thioester domain-containing protein n=1 Tax=Paractinoplanes bogorensis TaxID=1610840 RepID=A0ABS5Z1U7_9ACTN|nr:thioester domain-containing protein [Actinoplanes bogorensis]MBU2669670.1 thioester domain-containing protein [Actinoplanes bogorensis]
MLRLINRRWGRVVPVFVAGAGLLLGSAAPALAADEEELTAVARPDGSSRTLMLGGKATVVRGLEMTVDGGQVVPAFSLGFAGALPADDDYTSQAWRDSGVGNLTAVQWTLDRGFPSSDRATLIADAGVKVPAGASTATVDQLLRMGTQAALWHSTNRVTLNPWRAGAGLGNENEYAVIKKVYDFLIREGSRTEPRREVTFEEGSFNDAPVLSVHAPGGELDLKIEDGYAVTDSRYSGGTWLITEVVNGGGFPFILSTKAGVPTKVTVSAPHAITPGVVFTADGTQPITPAVGYGEPVTATFTKQYTVTTTTPQPSPPPGGGSPSATPSASPTATVPGDADGDDNGGGSLPITGAPTGAVLGGGLLLLVAGAVLVLLVRRRRMHFTS